jgi:hypothetical protein
MHPKIFLQGISKTKNQRDLIPLALGKKIGGLKVTEILLPLYSVKAF